MKKQILTLVSLGLLSVGAWGIGMETAMPVTEAAVTTEAKEKQGGWYWLSSDDNYSKYYDPESVVVVQSVNTARGQVPVEIHVWTKTTYSYGGAQETIANYGLQKKFPDATKLASSTAQLIVFPQYRTVKYQQEHFYDSAGLVIWSRADGKEKEKEINSQQFDEDFYLATVDQAFHQSSEMDQAKSKGRWVTIFDETTLDNVHIHTTADTSTMRMRGDNLIFWEWQEKKDESGKVQQIVFQKMAVNLPQGTEKVVTGRVWRPSVGWQSIDQDLDGQYHMVNRDSSQYKSILALREYVENNKAWVTRYSLE